ncbi:MAG: hypothetical protein LUD51_01760 [Clostridia bacterium]|nr:hypothetical protein [Clostridia bacterium]
MACSMPHCYKAKISCDGEHVLVYGKLLSRCVPDKVLFAHTSGEQIPDLFPSDP